MSSQPNEMVFKLRIVPPNLHRKTSVWLEEAQYKVAIRFDDVQSLAQYLRSITHSETTGGLQ